MPRLSATTLAFLCGTSALSMVHGAVAQTAAVQAKRTQRPAAVHAKTAEAAPARGGDPEPLTVLQQQPEEVTVSAASTPNGVTGRTPGGGLMPHQTVPYSKSGVTRDYIATQAPTTNALNLLRNTPGIVVASADPTGATDRMTVSIRGMNQNELGYEFEGMNPSDVLYYNPTTSGWADTENIGAITVTPGSPDLLAPTYSAVGGLINATVREPSRKRGGLLDLTYGGNNLQREFARFDTGELGRSGIHSFVSFSNTTASNWRGPGGLNRWHVDFKATKEWGDGNFVKAFMSYNDVTEDLYTYPTLSQWRASGYRYNYSSTFNGSNTNYYKFHQYEWKHARASVQTKFTLAPGLTLSATPYIFDVDGVLNGATTLSRDGSYLGSQPAGALQFPAGTASSSIAQSNDTFTESTFGLNSMLDWNRGHNDLAFGYWYSYVSYTENPSYSIPNAAGIVANKWGQYPLLTANGSPLYQWDAHLVQQSNALTLMDRYAALDNKLILTAGVKVVMLTRSATNLMPGATYRTGFSDVQPLPRVALSYQITPHDQIYVNGTTAFREAAAITPSIDMFSVATGKMTSAHTSGAIKPEFSIAEEIGYRHYGDINLALAFFNYNFTNRQVTSSALVNGTTVTSSINAGGQTSRGVTIELSTRRWHHFAPYFSGQYLHARIDNNIAAGSDYLRTTGKTAVLSPTWSGSIGLSYDDGSWFGNFSFNYVDSQYTTFMNDQSMPAYKTANVGVGYRFHDVMFFRRPQIQLNLINIGDAHYLSGAWGVTSNAKTVTGVYGTSIAGSQPTYLVGGNFTGTVSLTTGF
ncbi:TonB-dependent receptor [Ameyamaea chiangmaiensis NBRC 103196]|nr:TonB-dependent receptor plug domain-containing protein [Ameyamaea chiangmaiensis]GBQ65506.1 TonB-dependent receptor [Ameyamaea chiangmaiensis NBRC 103196]